MGNLATPNLPSRDFDATTEFYAALGFEPAYRDEGWLILTGHDVTVEFFLYPTLDPATSSFSCCLRLDDVDGFYETCRATGIPETDRGWPRLHPPRLEHSGLRIGYLVDPDGTLLRLVQNP
jgi:catechol 2,3-dioxygenase-like lactoylglutathione lyase family enzyme